MVCERAKACGMKRPKGIRKGQWLVVEWLDALTPEPGWDEHESGKKTSPDRVRSVGVVIKSTPAAVMLAGDAAPSYPKDTSTNRPIIVPWGMVVRVQRIDVRACKVIA